MVDAIEQRPASNACIMTPKWSTVSCPVPLSSSCPVFMAPFWVHLFVCGLHVRWPSGSIRQSVECPFSTNGPIGCRFNSISQFLSPLLMPCSIAYSIVDRKDALLLTALLPTHQRAKAQPPPYIASVRNRSCCCNLYAMLAHPTPGHLVVNLQCGACTWTAVSSKMFRGAGAVWCLPGWQRCNSGQQPAAFTSTQRSPCRSSV
jgi:hypothetical protein